MINLNQDSIKLRTTVVDKADAIAQVSNLLVKNGNMKPHYIASMMEREEVANTYLGNHIAIPHGLPKGAIPFAAKDPLRVLPASILGSAAAGALSMLFGCTLWAPHGGIFVLAIPNAVGNGGLYIVAIAIGTLVTALAITQFKRWQPKAKSHKTAQSQA